MTTEQLKEMLQNRINSLRNLAQQAYVTGDIEANLKYLNEADQTQITLDSIK